LLEIRWPSGIVDTLKDLDVNRLHVIQEGGKILKTEIFAPPIFPRAKGKA